MNSNHQIPSDQRNVAKSNVLYAPLEGRVTRSNTRDECTRKSVYKGESADSAYTRGDKHRSDLNARNVTNSPLWRHCRDIHDGVMQDFRMNVTGTFRNDAMLRQITEAVQIENVGAGELMDTRSDWNMTRVPRASIV